MPTPGPNRRPELVMAIVASVMALGVMTLAFQGAIEDRNNPNQSATAVATGSGLELTLEANRQGHYVASGQINGHEVTFLVDTGATTISIPGHVADRIGLERGMPIPTATAGGPVTSFATRLDTVSLGGIRRNDINASINPSMSIDEVLLGMNFLAPLELNQRGGQLQIRVPQDQ